MRFLHLCGFGLLFDGCLNVAYLLVQPTNMGFLRTLDHRVRTMLQVIFMSLWSLTRCSLRLFSRPHCACSADRRCSSPWTFIAPRIHRSTGRLSCLFWRDTPCSLQRLERAWHWRDG